MIVLVTGAAGFIGMHVTTRLLARGETVLGIDDLNAYYEPALKRARLAELNRLAGPDGHFRFVPQDVADHAGLLRLVTEAGGIDRVVHLAAQAGARHSLVEPHAFAHSNLLGQLGVLETCRATGVRHLVYASSSSVYGNRSEVPFRENDAANNPVSLYAATKRADELMSYAYAQNFALPATGLRFFTAYGPWGRPDMAYWSFATAIIDGRPIRLFGNGQMRRDFTYIDDIATGVIAALDNPPMPDSGGAPHRIFNLGNARAEPVRRLIETLEKALGRTAIIEQLGMQAGDVRETFADVTLASGLLGYAPTTSLDEGIPRFVTWLRGYLGR